MAQTLEQWRPGMGQGFRVGGQDRGEGEMGDISNTVNNLKK